MSGLSASPPADLELPLRHVLGGQNFIPAPSTASFTYKFGDDYPKPQYLKSDLGTTAVYDVPPPSGETRRKVLIIHGLNTPALGMFPLAKALQALDPDTHIVLFDLWGHGLSSTPLVAHTAHIFHYQIFQVLGFMKWTSAHFLGFSFGGVTTVKFATDNPWVMESVGVLAPAGMIPDQMFGQRLLNLLDDSKGRETEAQEAILDFLEGGVLEVPEDWEARNRSGEVVPEALRQWELDEHKGYPHSILSMSRNGIRGNEEAFRTFAQSPVRKIGIVAQLDPVCSKERLEDAGWSNVKVVPQSHHGFVRSHAKDVARIVHEFWTQ
ncbi:alpha/beta-hydrolase [Xylariaceae sp. FL1019]|nr:alpha/beta-hydrolase [Xylariaceae sp. FL1019]